MTDYLTTAVWLWYGAVCFFAGVGAALLTVAIVDREEGGGGPDLKPVASSGKDHGDLAALDPGSDPLASGREVTVWYSYRGTMHSIHGLIVRVDDDDLELENPRLRTRYLLSRSAILEIAAA